MSEVDTSPEAIAVLVEDHNKGKALDCRGFTALELAAPNLVPAIAAERDAAVKRAKQAEAREAAMKSANDEARQYLRERDALKADAAKLADALIETVSHCDEYNVHFGRAVLRDHDLQPEHIRKARAALAKWDKMK